MSLPDLDNVELVVLPDDQVPVRVRRRIVVDDIPSLSCPTQSHGPMFSLKDDVVGEGTSRMGFGKPEPCEICWLRRGSLINNSYGHYMTEHHIRS